MTSTQYWLVSEISVSFKGNIFKYWKNGSQWHIRITQNHGEVLTEIQQWLLMSTNVISNINMPNENEHTIFSISVSQTSVKTEIPFLI